MKWYTSGSTTSVRLQEKVNKEWAAKMLEIGLIPSSNGQIGGKQTGQRMSHLIEENGRFSQAATKLLKDHPAILYHDRSSENETARKNKAASKTKYTCPKCWINAWAKPNVALICGVCEEPMQAGALTL